VPQSFAGVPERREQAEQRNAKHPVDDGDAHGVAPRRTSGARSTSGATSMMKARDVIRIGQRPYRNASMGWNLCCDHATRSRGRIPLSKSRFHTPNRPTRTVRSGVRREIEENQQDVD
jgi:hypothetical protein